jgi:hypothetical protein
MRSGARGLGGHLTRARWTGKTCGGWEDPPRCDEVRPMLTLDAHDWRYRQR